MSAFKTAAAAILWLLFILLSFAVTEWGSFGGGDFHTVYYTANDYLPYQIPYPTVIGHLEGSWIYPPLLLHLVAPLAYSFDVHWATRLWYVLSLVALLFLLARLYRYVPQKDRFFYWVFAAFFAPVFEALHFGQVTVLLLVLIGFAWLSVKEGRFWVAGALLALAAWIKVYPFLLIVYFLWRGQWAVVKSALLTGIALGLFQVLISGPGIFLDFFASLVLIAGQSDHNLMWKNQSIYGFASRLFEANPNITPVVVNSTLFILTRYGLTLLVVGAFFVYSARSRVNAYTKERQFDLEYALAVMTMLLLSPWLYASSIVPALLTFFLIWINTHDLRTRLILCIAHLALVISYLIFSADFGTTGIFIDSLGFCALMTLWAVNVSLLMKLRSRQVEAATLIAS